MFKHWFTVARESQLRNLWDPTQRMGINEAHEEIDKLTEEFMQAKRLIKTARHTNVDRKNLLPPKGEGILAGIVLCNLRRRNLRKTPQDVFVPFSMIH